MRNDFDAVFGTTLCSNYGPGRFTINLNPPQARKREFLKDCQAVLPFHFADLKYGYFHHPIYLHQVIVYSDFW